MSTERFAWWLPKGSIRALLAIIVVSATTYVLAINSEYGLLAGLAVIVINFYFLKDALGKTASDKDVIDAAYNEGVSDYNEDVPTVDNRTTI
jgi:hypothetical protein